MRQNGSRTPRSGSSSFASSRSRVSSAVAASVNRETTCQNTTVGMSQIRRQAGLAEAAARDRAPYDRRDELDADRQVGGQVDQRALSRVAIAVKAPEGAVECDVVAQAPIPALPSRRHGRAALDVGDGDRSLVPDLPPSLLGPVAPVEVLEPRRRVVLVQEPDLLDRLAAHEHEGAVHRVDLARSLLIDFWGSVLGQARARAGSPRQAREVRDRRQGRWERPLRGVVEAPVPKHQPAAGRCHSGPLMDDLDHPIESPLGEDRVGVEEQCQRCRRSNEPVVVGVRESSVARQDDELDLRELASNHLLGAVARRVVGEVHAKGGARQRISPQREQAVAQELSRSGRRHDDDVEQWLWQPGEYCGEPLAGAITTWQASRDSTPGSTDPSSSDRPCSGTSAGSSARPIAATSTRRSASRTSSCSTTTPGPGAGWSEGCTSRSGTGWRSSCAADSARFWTSSWICAGARPRSASGRGSGSTTRTSTASTARSGSRTGFCVLSESADVLYLCSTYHSDDTERGIAYD